LLHGRRLMTHRGLGAATAAVAVARTSATESAILELVNMAVSPLCRDQGRSLIVCKTNIAGDAGVFYPTEVAFAPDRGPGAGSYEAMGAIIPKYWVIWLGLDRQNRVSGLHREPVSLRSNTQRPAARVSRAPLLSFRL
jgi:hypothetical protein